MFAEIAKKLEMVGKPAFRQHFPAIAAYREYPPRFDQMVGIQFKHPLLTGDGALVTHGLSVIFAFRFQPIQLEQSVRGGMEGDAVQCLGNAGIANRQWAGGDKTRIGKTGFLCQPVKIAPIERA